MGSEWEKVSFLHQTALTDMPERMTGCIGDLAKTLTCQEWACSQPWAFFLVNSRGGLRWYAGRSVATGVCVCVRTHMLGPCPAGRGGPVATEDRTGPWCKSFTTTLLKITQVACPWKICAAVDQSHGIIHVKTWPFWVSRSWKSFSKDHEGATGGSQACDRDTSTSQSGV